MMNMMPGRARQHTCAQAQTVCGARMMNFGSDNRVLLSVVAVDDCGRVGVGVTGGADGHLAAAGRAQ